MLGRTPEIFSPRIQRLGRKYRLMKALLWGGVLLGSFWIFEGRAIYRRFIIGFDGVPEGARSSDGFLAISFPRISKNGGRFTMSQKDFEATILGLKEQGFLSIGISDIEEFYLKNRALPPKAVLIALDRDNADTVDRADAVLKKARMRGLLFLNKTLPPGVRASDHRLALTPHAVNQLKKSGAWDIGWTSDHAPARLAADPIRPPVLDLGESKHAWSRNPYHFPVRFIVSRSAYNDSHRMMSALRILRVRTDRSPEQNLRAIVAFWPRRQPFSDEFKTDGLGLDWVSERGVVVAIGNRMVLVPTPKQKTASAFLSGTDTWRDCVAEFELAKYRKDAWLYARSAEGRWIRVGARNGFWYVQQKAGADNKPMTIARAPMTVATAFPARVRLVLKDQWAIVHVNGRMQFGKALRVHSGVDQGRVELDVYAERPAAALAVVTRFSAAPLGRHWLAVNSEAFAANLVGEEALADDVRDSAVLARVLSPRWLDVLSDGRIAPADAGRELVRHLAGYYRCQFVPMVDFAAPNARLPHEPAAVDLMLNELMAAIHGTEAIGLNLRLSASRTNRGHAAYFLEKLRARLHQSQRRLWITLDGERLSDAPWAAHADGVLRVVGQPGRGTSVLEQRTL